MNVPGARDPAPEPGTTRFDRKFIEEHRLVERYLEEKLPYKGARELENWCRANPEFLEEMKLTERTHASLKLLEASGLPQDLREPPTPWWKTMPFIVGLGIAALASLFALWTLFGTYSIVKGDLADARVKLRQGNLEPPATQSTMRVEPDRGPNLGGARVAINHAAPALLALLVDMGFSHAAQFRVIVDKRDQGRALVIENLLKDSNGDLRVTFNTSALPPGLYDVRIESMPAMGVAGAEGWLTLDAH
jgi:hypothetical protein